MTVPDGSHDPSTPQGHDEHHLVLPEAVVVFRVTDRVDDLLERLGEGDPPQIRGGSVGRFRRQRAGLDDAGSDLT